MIIYCHPSIVAEIKEQAKDIHKDVYGGPAFKDSIKNILDIKVIPDENIPVEMPTGKYERSNTLPDDRFTSWVDDMKNPPSWAIYFGLVKEEQKRIIYIEKNTTFMNMYNIFKETKGRWFL